MSPSVTLSSPLDHQVIQRCSVCEGVIPATGVCTHACGRIEVRISVKTMDGLPHATAWLPTNLNPATGIRRVAAFDGATWRIADDARPGAHDDHNQGGFRPSFGDAMAVNYRVPIGVAVTGHAGMNTESHVTGLADIFNGWRIEPGRDFPIFVAQATFIPLPTAKPGRKRSEHGSKNSYPGK